MDITRLFAGSNLDDHSLHTQLEVVDSIEYYSRKDCNGIIDGKIRKNKVSIKWDEDKDKRVYYAVKAMYIHELLFPIYAIGEREGTMYLDMAFNVNFDLYHYVEKNVTDLFEKGLVFPANNYDYWSVIVL